MPEELDGGPSIRAEAVQLVVDGELLTAGRGRAFVAFELPTDVADRIRALAPGARAELVIRLTKLLRHALS